MNAVAERVSRLLNADDSQHTLTVRIGSPMSVPWPVGFELKHRQVLAPNTIVEVVGGAHCPAFASYEETGDVCTLLIGAPAHARIPRTELAGWISQQVALGRPEELAAVEGPFFALVLDSKDAGVHVITDALGALPIFLRRHDGATWLSTHVGRKWDATLLPARVNMDSVRSWAVFGYNATDGALWEGWRRLGAAAHLEVAPTAIRDAPYHQIRFTGSESNAPSLTDRMIDCVGRALKTQTQGASRCKLSLSGGFDSRLLAALACEQRLRGLEVYTINGSGNWRDLNSRESTESQIARRVCEALNCPLSVIDIGNDAMSAFPEPFLLMADGLPLTRQLIDVVARRGDAAPVMNGFLGDNLMRGSWDLIDGKVETEFSHSAIVAAMLRRHSQLPGYLLRERVARRLNDWAHQYLQDRMAPLLGSGQAVSHLDLTMRQRMYMSNNFLQHMDWCEPIMPFATAELVDMKFAASPGLLDFDSFRLGMSRRFPAISHIPHSKDLATPGSPRFRYSLPSTRRWAIQSLLALVDTKSLNAFNRRRLLPRLSAALVDGRQSFVADTAIRFAILEELVSQLKCALDWAE